MNRVFGDFVEPKEGSGEYLKIGFCPDSVPLQQRWRNNGLSADFLAGYVSTFFPGDDAASSDRQAEIKDAISFIANELLENAMKFNHGSGRHVVSIEMFLEAGTIDLYTTNAFDPNRSEPFQRFIERMLTEDTIELYAEQIERNAEDGRKGASGLGFLTILNDYGAALAWKFTDGTEDDVGNNVTTMVRLLV